METASTAPAPAPTESPRMAPRAQRHTAVEGLPEGTAQQMKALKEATKAYNRAHHEAHRLGKLLDVNLEEISEVEAKVMLHAQQLGYNKKQAPAPSHAYHSLVATSCGFLIVAGV
eukprot:s3832_g1.t3